MLEVWKSIQTIMKMHYKRAMISNITHFSDVSVS